MQTFYNRYWFSIHIEPLIVATSSIISENLQFNIGKARPNSWNRFAWIKVRVAHMLDLRRCSKTKLKLSFLELSRQNFEYFACINSRGNHIFRLNISHAYLLWSSTAIPWGIYKGGIHDFKHSVQNQTDKDEIHNYHNLTY